MREENGAAAGQVRAARVHAFSYIRAIACIAIVVLHTVFCAVSLFAQEASQTQALVSKAVVNNLMWAVPCFLMVSGALLLDPGKEISVRKIFRKYIPRMLIALAAFCILFRVLEILVNQEPVTWSTVFSGLYEILAGTSWSHMWYLYLMIGIYLLLPFYKKITAHSSPAEIRYLLLICVVFLSLLPALKIWNISVGFYI
ncbi:MAG: acyltransferase, partial [Hominenteromicrobium sp.]